MAGPDVPGILRFVEFWDGFTACPPRELHINGGAARGDANAQRADERSRITWNIGVDDRISHRRRAAPQVTQKRSGGPGHHSASAHTRGGSSSLKNSRWITFGLQQTGQSSTYSCS